MKKKLLNFKTSIILRINEDKTGTALCHGKITFLNEVAVKFLLALEDNYSEVELVEQICQEYDIDPKIVTKDFYFFKEKLKKMEIL